MTTDTAAPAITPRIGQQLRGARFWIVVGVVVAVLAGAGLVQAAGTIGRTFDPSNPQPQGAKALAQVLRQQGVAVREVRTVADARTGTGTLLVDDADQLLTADDWQDLLASTERIVVVSPGFEALRQVAPEVRQAGQPDGTQADGAQADGTRADANCDLALAGRAGSMALDDVTLSLRAEGDAVVCFTDDRGAGQLVTLRTGGTRVVLLADRTAFTNERIAVAGNAAVALNALGASDALTWFSPDPQVLLPQGDRTLQDLTPEWVTPVALLLLLAGAVAALWRGRRLGPIVVEALPVAVRSRETVEGRARLYAAGRARLRAADSLRIGAVGRMAPVLGLSSTASVEDVAGAAARATGRRSADLTHLLLTAEPATDRDLVRLSDDLARLEGAVGAAVSPGTEAKKGTTR